MSLIKRRIRLGRSFHNFKTMKKIKTPEERLKLDEESEARLKSTGMKRVQI